MWIFVFYLASNTLFTLITIQMGYSYYGYGFFLSSALTFFLAAALLLAHVRKLPYHAFITNNNSVKLPKEHTSADYYESKGDFNMGVDRREIIHPGKA